MKPLLALVLFSVLLLSQPGSTQALISAGAALKRSEAEELERALAAKPKDLDRRVRLIGYYFGSELSGNSDDVRARARHLAWIVEHQPESAIWQSQAALLNDLSAPDHVEAHKSVRAAWLKLIQAKISDTALIHAARFFAVVDRARAGELVGDVLKRNPKDGEARFLLGMLEGMSALNITQTLASGLPDPDRAAPRLSPGGQATLQGIAQAKDSRRACGAAAALMKYGSVLMGGSSGNDILAASSSLAQKGLRLDGSDEGCREAAERVDAWGALKRAGRLTTASPSGVPLLVDGQLASSWRIGGATPRYPSEAKQRRVQGDVVAVAVVGADGAVVRTEVIDGPPELRSAAAEISGWRYRPMVLHGIPTAFTTDVRITFRFY